MEDERNVECLDGALIFSAIVPLLSISLFNHASLNYQRFSGPRRTVKCERPD